MSDKIFLIDGHNLIFKMYYAFLRRPMINSKGADMSILYGFTKYILEMIEKQKPQYMAIAFDPPGGTFRNRMYPEYKATRSETPQLVIDALEPLQEICKALGICTLMVIGYEADDVVGTVAKRCQAEGLDVYMVTPDKDYGQLIDDHIWQYKPGKAGSDDTILGKAEVCEKYGIQDPEQVIEMLTICGDTSDNVPGVKGVGEVGASKLISRYGSVEGIYAHINELTDRQKAQFEEAKEHIALSHDLVTIRLDVPVETSTSEMTIGATFTQEVADLFEKYEFNSLRKHLRTSSGPALVKRERKTLDLREVSPAEAIEEIRKRGRFSIISETDLSKVTVATAAKDGPSCTVAEGTVNDFRAIIEDEGIAKYGYDLKKQMNLLDGEGVRMRGKFMDIELMHYLLNPEQSHRLDILAKSYLGIDLDEDEEVSDEPSLLFSEAAEEKSRSHCKEAEAEILLADKVLSDMEKADVLKLYDKMEEPLVKVLAKMERNGVKVDIASLKDYASSLQIEVGEHEANVRALADEPNLNVGSPKQIGQVIFEKLQLDPKAKKSAKSNWSTDEQTLSALADRHPIINEILEYRAAKKLLSTYIEPFPGYISPLDGKVHTTFNQALTSTGRLSSSNPNLQNIPIRTERGKEIRKAFVPENPDGLILSADYSQIELRIMAHLCCDSHMLQAFRDGIDVHKATASKIFGIPAEEVTSEQRRIAKTANFGIMYGISSFGLSQRLGCSRGEAKKIIDDYFEAFPSIRTFIDDTIASAKENGFVETIFGRRRYIPDINSGNATVRALAERNAVNAPIQGTAADIIKLAMIGVDKEMERSGLKSRMVLQIHDELVFDAVPQEIETLKEIVVGQMENVVKLSIPLTVECNYGKNWLEAH